MIVSVDELNYQTKNVLRLWAKEKGVEVMDLTERSSIPLISCIRLTTGKWNHLGVLIGLTLYLHLLIR